MNVDMKKETNPDQTCYSDHDDEDLDENDLILGPGQVDVDVLSNIIQSFFGEKDRRKYKGKHRNSPMIIKFDD